jgi:hypothetical protein
MADFGEYGYSGVILTRNKVSEVAVLQQQRVKK